MHSQILRERVQNLNSSQDIDFWKKGIKFWIKCQRISKSLVHGSTTQKCIPMNESLLLLIDPVKTSRSLWQAAKSVNYEILKEISSF